jgi:hypothetical protein
LWQTSLGAYSFPFNKTMQPLRLIVDRRVPSWYQFSLTWYSNWRLPPVTFRIVAPRLMSRATFLQIAMIAEILALWSQSYLNVTHPPWITADFCPMDANRSMAQLFMPQYPVAVWLYKMPTYNMGALWLTTGGPRSRNAKKQVEPMHINVLWLKTPRHIGISAKSTGQMCLSRLKDTHGDSRSFLCPRSTKLLCISCLRCLVNVSDNMYRHHT